MSPRRGITILALARRSEVRYSTPFAAPTTAIRAIKRGERVA
jgi:hypothetical protein